MPSASGGSRPRGARAQRPRGARAAADAAPTRPKRERDPLLAAICHDLRAPLASVTMGASFVLQSTPDEPANARTRRILEAMLRSCAQMDRLVRNFADLSEIEADALQLRLAEHDAREVLELAARAVHEEAASRGVRVEVLPAEQPVTVRCDRDRLLRALVHLAENAVRHAPEGSAVTLEASAADGELTFRVTDRGPGLSDQLREHLFDRQWHATRAGRSGSGFGLAIARGFALAHGGRLEASPAEAAATSFELTVPASGPTAEPAGWPGADPPPGEVTPGPRRP